MAPKSILIVDDDRNVRQSMALVLRRANYQVDTAGSAAEALAALRVGRYDLTILDMMMPDNGSILLPKVLNLYPDLSILVLTTQSTTEKRHETDHAGLHFRLTKPVTPEALLKRVKTILDKSAAASGSGRPEKILL